MRIRTIKPTFFLNDTLAECDPLARLLFIGLWCAADCEGRLEVRPKRLKAEILPFDDCDIAALISQLEKHGFLDCYDGDGMRVCQVRTFTRHQRLSGTEADAKSNLPSKEAMTASKEEAMTAASLADRKEGRKGREGKECAHDFPTLEQATAMVLTAGIPDRFVAFIYDDWSSRGGRDGANIEVPFLRYATKRWTRERVEWQNGTHKGNHQSNGRRDDI